MFCYTSDYDPCANNNINCSYGCVLENSEPVCYCPENYKLSIHDNQTCSGKCLQPIHYKEDAYFVKITLYVAKSARLPPWYKLVIIINDEKSSCILFAWELPHKMTMLAFNSFFLIGFWKLVSYLIWQDKTLTQCTKLSFFI